MRSIRVRLNEPSPSAWSSPPDVAPRLREDHPVALIHPNPPDHEQTVFFRPTQEIDLGARSLPTSTYLTRIRVMFSFAVEYAIPSWSATVFSGRPAA